MTIAVTYEKETGNVFQHFGKTEYFKLYQKSLKGRHSNERVQILRLADR